MKDSWGLARDGYFWGLGVGVASQGRESVLGGQFQGTLSPGGLS